ncbi:MAG TPA: peptidoglycan DD-metalloendopeptidase family protein [Polyangiaceae bacterium]|nr:peptidoglycan DD-metalloendopeptidase family protein [Polyangiaceae bacterium]
MSRSRWVLLFVCMAGSSAALNGEPPPPAEPPSDPAGSNVVPSSTSIDLERLLNALDREEQNLKKRQGDIERESGVAHARSVARGRAYVRLVRAGLLPVGGGFDALVDHATRLERLYRGLSNDLSLERRLTIERRVIGEKLEAIRARRAPLEVERKLVADSQALVLAEEERRVAFQNAFAQSSDPARTAVYGAAPGPSDPQETASGFAALKGRLPFPITGRTEVRSGRRAGSEGPGIEFRAPSGTAVRAVFPGRVAFADVYADYGQTVILDHGSRHYTVSANLASLDVKVGDEISSGERIGTVGALPSGSLLYFEVRVGKDTVDPAEWLGL